MIAVSGSVICLGIILWFIFKPPNSRGAMVVFGLAVLFIAMTPGAAKIRETISGVIETTNTTVDKTVTTP